VPAVLRAGIVFGGICVCVCLHKIWKTADQELILLGGNMSHGECKKIGDVGP